MDSHLTWQLETVLELVAEATACVLASHFSMQQVARILSCNCGHVWCWYITFNVAVDISLFMFGSSLTTAFVEGKWGEILLPLLMQCASIALYFTTALKDPGYGPCDPLPEDMSPSSAEKFKTKRQEMRSRGTQGRVAGSGGADAECPKQ